MEVEASCPVLLSNCCYLSVSYIDLEYSYKERKTYTELSHSVEALKLICCP